MPTVQTSDSSIYYEVAGEGPAIVFAHGAGGNRLSWWQQVPFFEQSYRVIRLDHRTFGRSTCDEGAFHPKHFARDLLAILDAEEIERAALVCQSLGGWTGLRASVETPERVACLVLCDTPGGVAHPKIREAAAGVGERIARDGVKGSAALAPGFEKRKPALAHLYDQIASLNTGFDMKGLGLLFSDEASIAQERLEGYATPTLMVAGEQDLLFPSDALRLVAELIPGALFREFKGCGHSVYFEDAEAFNRAVSEFVGPYLGRG
jgi:pimeloyl-ACP methyl ester carboxylesterase